MSSVGPAPLGSQEVALTAPAWGEFSILGMLCKFTFPAPKGRDLQIPPYTAGWDENK